MAQTFPHWELLLYDDGSPSPYSGAIRRAAGLDPRVRYLRGEENRGLAFCLNQCLAHSQGEYLARLDDDDACAPGGWKSSWPSWRPTPSTSGWAPTRS